jgi:hypothetical protein
MNWDNLLAGAPAAPAALGLNAAIVSHGEQQSARSRV